MCDYVGRFLFQRKGVLLCTDRLPQASPSISSDDEKAVGLKIEVDRINSLPSAPSSLSHHHRHHHHQKQQHQQQQTNISQVCHVSQSFKSTTTTQREREREKKKKKKKKEGKNNILNTIKSRSTHYCSLSVM